MRSIEYSQANDLVSSLEVNDKVYIDVGHLPNFRKYLRELGKKNEKQFTTRLRQEESDKLKVIRIK